MICEECKKRNATVYINQSIGDKVKTSVLCAECAEKSRSDGRGDDPAQSSSEDKHIKKNQIQCPDCHCTVSSFEASKNLTLGCPECYKVFSDNISRRLRFLRGRLVYCGRVPLRQRQAAKKAEYLEKLRAEMAQAVSSEDFERALTLREMIKSVG
jgi:protein arginine kinase activator